MEDGRARSLPSSASSSSSTPVSWHFLLWAFDFMCLVRFPGKERGQTQVQVQDRAGEGQRQPWLLTPAEALPAQGRGRGQAPLGPRAAARGGTRGPGGEGLGL